MAYTNSANIQNYLLINIDSSMDSQIAAWISAVKNYIDNYCNRTFEQESGITYKLYDGDGTNELLIDDLYSFTKVEILNENGDVDYTISDSDEYYLYPTNQENKNRIVINKYNADIPYFPKGNQNVKIYGSFGYSSTAPEAIRLAATKLVAGIIQEKAIDISGEIKRERLGEYDVTFQDVEKMANHLGIHKILDQYRMIKV